MDTPLQPMTADSVRELLETAGAEVMARSGRSEHYSAPREFSFEAKGIFPNGMTLHVVARQFNYRDPWEASGRVNDLVDVLLFRDGGLSTLPKGYPFSKGSTRRPALMNRPCGRSSAVFSQSIPNYMNCNGLPAIYKKRGCRLRHPRLLKSRSPCLAQRCF